MLTPSQNLAISYVIIYPTILLPANYCLIRHGKYGILGWIGLISFCAVRIVGAILELLDSKSIAAQIISGVGLNPLILGVLGIIHESYVVGHFLITFAYDWLRSANANDIRSMYRSHYISTKKPWALKLPPYLLLHGTAMGAVGLIVPGFVSPKSSSASSLIRVGTMLLLVVWLVLVGLCILSLKFPKENTDAQRVSQECPTLPQNSEHPIKAYPTSPTLSSNPS